MRIVSCERLLLGGERRRRLRVRGAVKDDLEAAFRDPRLHVDGDVQRRRADLLEPEAMLLDEVEGEAVAPLRAWGDDRHLDLDRLARFDGPRQRGANAVPHDRVSEGIEPVVRDLDSLAPARSPRRSACVLELEAPVPGDARARLLELVRQPADGERPHGHGVLADSFHGEG